MKLKQWVKLIPLSVVASSLCLCAYASSDLEAIMKARNLSEKILRAYVWVVRPPILVNESLLTNTERAPGNRVAKYRARPQAARRYAA